MKRSILISLLLVITAGFTIRAQELKLDTRIDNNGYWKEAAARGLTTLNPVVPVKAASFTGSEIMAVSVITENSPDVAIVTENTSQSENSISVNPLDIENAVNSNNSTDDPSGGVNLYGADALQTFDGGETWTDDVTGAGGSNSGDPVSLISNTGRVFIGFIKNSGQGIAFSDDQGSSWTSVQVAPSPGGFGGLLDKNHMWVDNSTSSPYEGYLYNAWTAFGGPNDEDIELKYSSDGGLSWSSSKNLSSNLNAGSHNQGVNISTGPNGEAYAVWAIYDSWPSDESALGFARSYDGGQTWESFRIIENIRGIRTSETSKNMRVNSFPCMDVDISQSSNRGTIYVTWSNIGVPGINQGPDIDVYVIRSEDNGDTWSEPVRVNQDQPNLGHQHYFPWLTCDPETGTLSAVFYDDRNVGGNQLEVYCANSYDGGNSWEDFKVSDVSFTPSPIPGLASGYFGDYIGITARGGNVYPVWTDNRTGTALTYVSPYQTSVLSAPSNLEAELDDETGVVGLGWEHNPGGTFEYYKIYRNFAYLGTSVLPTFTDTLPGYGIYKYRVTAFYSAEGESGPAIANVQWGNAAIGLEPDGITEYLSPGGASTRTIQITNPGELELTFIGNLDLPEPPAPPTAEYCAANGGCDEFIANVDFLTVSEHSTCGQYTNNSDKYSIVAAGQTFDISVLNGWDNQPSDICNIWIDWNRNGQFVEEGTLPVTGSPGIGPYVATATVPEDAATGMTVMRIRLSRGNPSYPCGVAPRGEVEDYGLYVLSWLKAYPLSGDVPPGESQPLTLEFNTNGLELGTYQCIIHLTTNDPLNTAVDIPVTLIVEDIYLEATADKDEICLGQGTTLHANVTGGSGNFTYSWTSDPPGFTSSEPDPQVSPEVTTTYFVEATDGSLNLEGEVGITVFPLPEIDLGTNGSFCENESYTIDAGEGYASYFWSDGSNSQSVEVTEGGTYWVEVTNDNGCASRDTIELTRYPLPVVDLGNDFSFCENTQATLDAGAGFATYLWNTGSTERTIEVDQAGEYWVEVTSPGDCSNGDTITLSVDPLPGQPTITSGPTEVDLYATTSSPFTASEASDAESYVWTLDPSNAGTLNSNGLQAEVEWNGDFTGLASLRLTAGNDCGPGEPSEEFAVTVYSSLDIKEIPGISGLKIYPNPTDGDIIIRMTAENELRFNVNVLNMLGSRVGSHEFNASRGTNTFRLDMDSSPEGIYTLVITSDEGSLERKIVVSR